jgi:hypothetical protein
MPLLFLCCGSRYSGTHVLRHCSASRAVPQLAQTTEVDHLELINGQSCGLKEIATQVFLRDVRTVPSVYLYGHVPSPDLGNSAG